MINYFSFHSPRTVDQIIQSLLLLIFNSLFIIYFTIWFAIIYLPIIKKENLKNLQFN